MFPRSTTFGTEVLALPGNNLACVLLKKLSSFDVFGDETSEACPSDQTLPLLHFLMVNLTWKQKIPSEMAEAPRYTLFTLFIMFELLFTYFHCLNSSMYAYIHILIVKVRTLLELQLICSVNVGWLDCPNWIPLRLLWLIGNKKKNYPPQQKKLSRTNNNLNNWAWWKNKSSTLTSSLARKEKKKRIHLNKWAWWKYKTSTLTN